MRMPKMKTLRGSQPRGRNYRPTKWQRIADGDARGNGTGYCAVVIDGDQIMLYRAPSQVPRLATVLCESGDPSVAESLLAVLMRGAR